MRACVRARARVRARQKTHYVGVLTPTGMGTRESVLKQARSTHTHTHTHTHTPIDGWNGWVDGWMDRQVDVRPTRASVLPLDILIGR